METVQLLRQLESTIVSDAKSANSLLDIKKHLKNDENPVAARMAALHSSRRIFVNFLENARFKYYKEDTDKVKEYKLWIYNQFLDFQTEMARWITVYEDERQAAAVRTMLEFVRREHLTDGIHSLATVEAPLPRFGTRAYSCILKALLSTDEINIDILLMIREEVFNKPDCVFYTMRILKTLTDQLKREVRKGGQGGAGSASASYVRNMVDMLRVVSIPDCVDDTSTHLVPLAVATAGDDSDADLSDDEDEESNSDVGHKRKASSADASARKKGLSRSKLLDIKYYKKAFSKVWLTLLSVPLHTTSHIQQQIHKLILKHLPDHVIMHLDNPLLLADYLTRSYNQGGPVAILALEGLFVLITQYNFDYPMYFTSLYKLCSVSVFNAKYRLSFFRLLHSSLKSTNIAAYVAAAFIKRLAGLAVQGPSPCAPFCVAQVAWLLRAHPHCLVMLHNQGNSTADLYNSKEEASLEATNALNSSLWELEILKYHHLSLVVEMVAALERVESTVVKSKVSGHQIGNNTPLDRGVISKLGELLNPSKYMSSGFLDMIENHLLKEKDIIGLGNKANKRNGNGKGIRGKEEDDIAVTSALGFHIPDQLLASSSIVASCFGNPTHTHN